MKKNNMSIFKKYIMLSEGLREADDEAPATDTSNPFGGGGGGDAGGDTSGGDANPFGGGDAGGDTSGGDAGDGGTDDTADGDSKNGEDEKGKVDYFSKKVKDAKKIILQRSEPEPDMDFAHFNDFIKDNYFSKTKNGSLMLPVPTLLKEGKLFMDKVAVPYVKRFAQKSIDSNRKVIILTNASQQVLNYLRTNALSSFGNKVVVKEWNTLYNDKLVSELKTRTETSSDKIKLAIKLYFIGIKGGNVNNLDDSTLDGWGISPDSDSKDIAKLLYPEYYDQPENEASFIVKTYLQLLQLYFIKNVIKFENSGYTVIAPVDKFTAWKLNKTFSKSMETILDKKAKETEEPKSTEDTEQSTPPAEDNNQGGGEETTEKNPFA